MQKIKDNLDYLYFISHMVQMKEAILVRVCPCPANFISHMVQMKDSLNKQLGDKLLALYPTWFR